MSAENRDNIESLLEQIEDILAESKSTLGGGKIKVDRDELLEIIQEIRLQMPDELLQARKIAANRKGILDKAQAEADERVAEGEKEAARLIEDNEITKKAKSAAADIISQAKTQSDEMIARARSEAQSIMENADKWSRDIRANATDFVDSIMNDCDEILSNGVSEMNKSIKDIRTAREQIKRAVAKKG
ncbi:MAG: hypothetical protein IJ766_02990 [Clostridia bacterium]|nr:hypothetical protein [Clostridia bacterium]